jgi:hypothetical protein
MRAETAAAYCDERSVEAFRNGVGTLYPHPKWVRHKGDRWLKEELDRAIEVAVATTCGAAGVKDACDVL